VDGGTGTTPRSPEDSDLRSAVLCRARLPKRLLAPMWLLVAVLLFAVLLAFLPMLASVSAAVAFVGVLVWRLALLC
jgi:hypothetical protein